MSAEYEAAQEICSVLNAIDQNLDRMYAAMPEIRTRIATAALQGILANPAWNVATLINHGIPENKAADALAFISVRYADALIKALDAQEPVE
jgi:hypothetical protein